MYNRNINRLTAVIQSPIAPRSTNVLWDDLVSNTLKVYRKGIWTVIGGAGGGGEGSSLYWGYDEIQDVIFPLDNRSVQINGDLTVNGDITARKLSVAELEIDGEPFASYWELDSNTNTLSTTYQVLIKNSLIVEQDTSSGGDGQDTPGGGGLDEEQLQDYLDLHKYITEDALSSYYTKGESDARYLAQSGGTLLGGLQIGSDNNTSYLDIGVKRNNVYTYMATTGAGEGYIGVTFANGNYAGITIIDSLDTLYYNHNSVYKNIIHSGNIGSYAFVPKSEIANNTDADYLLTNGVYLNATGNGGGNSNFPSSYSAFLTFSQSSKYAAQISIGSNAIHMRRKIDSWSHWMRIIAENENGNVGIGTTTDLGYKLEVSGNVRITNSLELGAGRLDKYTLYSQVSGFKLIDKDNVERLGLYSYDKSCFIENLYGGVENCGIQFFDSGTIGFFGGNVGIGTTSPLSKLQVDGQINLSNGTNNNYAFISQDNYSSNTSWLKLGTCYGYNTESVAMTIYNGMVKIGNAIPTCELDVNGGIKATKPIFGYMFGTNNNAAAFIFDKPGSNYTGIGSDGVSDTIRFGACDADGTWVDGYAQKWKFYGDVIVTGDVASA